MYKFVLAHGLVLHLGFFFVVWNVIIPLIPTLSIFTMIVMSAYCLFGCVVSFISVILIVLSMFGLKPAIKLQSGKSDD